MKGLARYLFMGVILLALLLGLGQATSQAAYGYCVDVCCPAPFECVQNASWCRCTDSPDITTCWWYCDQACGPEICH
jgi:hypothetical protein